MIESTKKMADRFGISYEVMLDFEINHPYALKKMTDDMTKASLALIVKVKKELK